MSVYIERAFLRSRQKYRADKDTPNSSCNPTERKLRTWTGWGKLEIVRSLPERLENYTAQHPEEVLLVTIEANGETEEVVVFKGFSSSLSRATAFDPDVPVFPEAVKIVSVDRLRSPYQPDNPEYIQRGIAGEAIEAFLAGGQF